MHAFVTSIGIGFASGILSGAFGIGGGIITTPAIRLILGAPALIAVGTPLPVILPGALTGAITYARNGVADLRAGVTCGLAGSLTAVIGAWATSLVGGEVVLIATAALIFYAAGDMALQAFRAPKGPAAAEIAEVVAERGAPFVAEADPALVVPEHVEPVAVPVEPVAVPVEPAREALKLATIGVVTGLYSGFLGLGGGFVLVPLLTRWLGFDMKRAIATSLVAVTILAVPGTITHALLGHINWGIAIALSICVVPGAIIGARFTLGSSDRVVRLAFASLLLVVGVWLAATELFGLLP